MCRVSESGSRGPEFKSQKSHNFLKVIENICLINRYQGLVVNAILLLGKKSYETGNGILLSWIDSTNMNADRKD